MEENCTTCCYSEFTSLITNDLIGSDFCRCLYQNSPYYDEIVSNKLICRLYVNYNDYIKLKDRKEAISNIKNKYK